MIGLRKRLLFRVEESFPDPEEQKWRFRRRILLGTLAVALILLGIPVMQDRIPHLRTLRQARHLADVILETRLYAAQHRVAVSLRLNSHDRRTWVRTFHASGDCNRQDFTPPETIALESSVWRISAENELRTLCFDPHKGLLSDGTIHENILVLGYPEEDIESRRTDRVAQISLALAGAEVKILRN